MRELLQKLRTVEDGLKLAHSALRQTFHGKNGITIVEARQNKGIYKVSLSTKLHIALNDSDLTQLQLAERFKVVSRGYI